ncbi:hypothetical protein CEUSTIGMA_g6078.t1 [Chlamydomonas eustigma]|uniref:Uncharacterized protein n=1 Tax=Chlamydomonas eustigma TaxID=1157962 RepID=A0A250X7A4_9CHLO|nr:hypothetical protein CEUSTIGMA_g6078.t1 [Chlamydomonas eustigma]|eukprot:GAX78640.1 hypothetical protein CEUSTIGMA_g6078.t1 [Chlamydomonas eustigma]
MTSIPGPLPFLEGSSRAVGTVGQVVGRSLYGAQVKALLTCGLYIVATIALLLADVALVVWVFIGRGYSLEIALIIVSAVDVGLVLLMMIVILISDSLAARRNSRDIEQAQLQAQAAASGALIEAVSQLLRPMEHLLTSMSKQMMKLYKKSKNRGTGRGDSRGVQEIRRRVSGSPDSVSSSSSSSTSSSPKQSAHDVTNNAEQSLGTVVESDKHTKEVLEGQH